MVSPSAEMMQPTAQRLPMTYPRNVFNVSVLLEDISESFLRQRVVAINENSNRLMKVYQQHFYLKLL